MRHGIAMNRWSVCITFISWIAKQPSRVMEAIARSFSSENVFLKIMSVMFILVVLSVSVVSNVDVRDEHLTFSVDSVSSKYGAFNEIACAFVDRVNDVVVVP